jgi:hypothetical protein
LGVEIFQPDEASVEDIERGEIVELETGEEMV